MLKRVKELLAEVDARTAAKHITMADCRVRTPPEASHASTPAAAAHTNLVSRLLDRWPESWAWARRCRG